MKSKLFIDSNLFLKILLPDCNKKENRLLSKYYYRQYDIFYNIVVLTEIVRSKMKDNNRNFILNNLMVHEKCICPTVDDWKKSSIILLQFKENNPQYNREAMRKMQMDALIASISIRNGIKLLTQDRDFEIIKNTNAGKDLMIEKLINFKV